MDVVQNSLALFQPPLIDRCIEREYWNENFPVASISSQSYIEFSVPGTSMDYIDLKKPNYAFNLRLLKKMEKI